MIFIVRQIKEKWWEQDLYFVFVDLAKAFDTVNRDGLWNIMNIVKSLYEGMGAWILIKAPSPTLLVYPVA